MSDKQPPTPVQYGADDLIDTCARILQREVMRLERRRSLKAAEIDLVVRVAKAAAEICALQLDPLGPAGRRKLARMSAEELAEARARLERQEARQ